jgi:hypothetical protein
MIPGDLLVVTGEPAAWRPALMDAALHAALAGEGRRTIAVVEQVPLLEDQAAIDQVRLPAGEAHRLLCEVGMDAAAQGCPARQAGDADRWLLRLAIAIAEAGGHAPGRCLVAARRWGHDLDTVAARRLSRHVRGITRRRRITFILETARSELAAALSPDVHAALTGGAMHVRGPAAGRFLATLEPRGRTAGGRGQPAHR